MMTLARFSESLQRCMSLNGVMPWKELTNWRSSSALIRRTPFVSSLCMSLPMSVAARPDRTMYLIS